LTPEVFIQLAQDAHKELHRHHLHDALYLIDLLLKEVQLAEELDGFHQLEQSYNYLLNFISTGGKDEKSRELKLVMEAKAHIMLIKAERAYRLIHRQGEMYVQIARKLEEAQEDVLTLSAKMSGTRRNTAKRETLLDQLFYAIWTSKPWEENVMTQVFDLMEKFTQTELCLCISALTLALTEYIDTWKLLLLHKLSLSKEGALQKRALCGLVLASLKHPEQMQATEVSQFGIIEKQFASKAFQNDLAYINQAFLICQQAHAAHEKMENEILPHLIKLAQNGRNNIHINIDLDENGEPNVDLPVEDEKERKQLQNVMHKIVDMHQDGIDLNTGQMRFIRTLNFFKELPHWFLPYDKNRTELSKLSKNGGEEAVDFLNLLHTMSNNGECDIDQYATAFTIMHQADKEEKHTLQHMIDTIHELGDGIMSSFKVLTQDATGSPEGQKQAYLKYMKQLYRVFTMWPRCQEWKNPFTLSANWLENPILSLALNENREGLHYLADYLLKYKNYKEAETYLNQLVKLEGCDAETLRSAAFCKQQQGLYAAAVNLYIQADMLEPEHIWTLNQMQQCYAHLERHEQRLDCLLQLEQLEPENTKTISETGLCLMQLQRWQDASQRFYHLELEEKRIIPSQRAIAWCALQQGKTEQAMKYYQKVLDSTSARWQDYLNAGHAAWVMDDTVKAIELYRGYIQRYLTDDPKITDALTPFNEDNDLLLSLGKEQHEIDIMHDILE